MGQIGAVWHTPNAAEADEGHVTDRLGTSAADLVEDVSAIDKIGVAGEGNGLRRVEAEFRVVPRTQRVSTAWQERTALALPGLN
jgi:hypothetical protein